MKMRKLFAGIAAAATMLGGLALGAATAMADETYPQLGTTLTINAAGDGQLAGRTFSVYKLAGYSDVAGTGSIEVKTEADPVLSQVKAAVTEATKGNADAVNQYKDADGDPLAWAIQKEGRLDASSTSPWTGTTRVMAEMIDITKLTATKTTNAAAADAKQVVIDGLEPGLYLVADTTTPADDAKWTNSIRMVVSTAVTVKTGDAADQLSTGEINLKNEDLPTPKKEVNDPTPAAGQSVTFTVDSKVPNYVGYLTDSYTYKVQDSFTADAVNGGKIKYDAAGIESVTVGGTTLTADQYTVTYYKGEDAAGETTTDPTEAVSFSIDLSNYVRIVAGNETANGTFTKAALNGAAVQVTYKATAGIIGIDGVANKPIIEFSNKPGETTTGKTPGPQVKVYNLPLNILKTDKTTGSALSGAEFQIIESTKTGDALPKTATATDTNGKTAFTGLGAVTTTDKDGTKSFDVTYTVQETQAPADHVLPSDATFKVRITGKVSYENGITDLKYEIVSNEGGLSTFATAVSDTMTVTVQNAKNITELPLTGGAGIALFTAVGVLLAGVAATVFVKSRSAKRALMA